LLVCGSFWCLVCTVSSPTFPAARLPNKAHLQSKRPRLGGRGECIGTSAPAEHGSPELTWGGYSPRHFCSLLFFLDSKLPLQAELLASKRALLLWDSVSVLLARVFSTKSQSNRPTRRRCPCPSISIDNVPALGAYPSRSLEALGRPFRAKVILGRPCLG
jgi:hypothetical protein